MYDKKRYPQDIYYSQNKEAFQHIKNKSFGKNNSKGVSKDYTIFTDFYTNDTKGNEDTKGGFNNDSESFFYHDYSSDYLVSEDSDNDFGNKDEDINLIHSDVLLELNTKFIKEARELILCILKNSMNYDQICLEFVCFKNAQNPIPENIECAIAIILAILKYFENTDLNKGVNLLQPLLRVFLVNDDNQEDFLFWWQEYCAKLKEKDKIFTDVLNLFDELEILSDESLSNWEQQQDECDESQLRLFNNYQSNKLYY